MSESSPEAGTDAVRGASTLLEVLEILRERGYDGQLIPEEDGTIRCAGCDGRTAARDFGADGFHRLEGASDPADMNLVVWGACPACGEKGVVTVGYGPTASPADQAVLEGLDLHHVESADDGNAGG